MSVELGIREVQMITDAIKSVVNDAIYFGNPESFKMLDGSYMKNAEDWRTSIISNLTQGTPGNTYASHSSVLFNHTNKIDDNMGKIRLETLIDYALENFKAFEETETLGDLSAASMPEFLWTGFEETSEAIYDIAMELSSDFGLEIPSVGEYDGDIKTLLTETSEALMDSDIKVEDLRNSLELKIRVLDDIQANELYQMYATFPSTEGVRPFMIQLTELHDQIDNLDDDLAELFRYDVLDELYITRDPGDLLYKNAPNDAQVVKNQIKYFFEELTDLQERYIKFNNSPSTIFQSVHNSDIERMFSNIGSIEEPMRDAFGDMIFSSKEPAQFSSTFKVFDGSDTDLPFQINKTYMDRFQEIAGRKAYDVTLDPNYAVDLNKTKGMTAGEFLNDYVSKNIYDQRIDDDMREKLDRININDAKTDLPYDPRYVTPEELVQDINKATPTPTNVVDDFYVVPPDKLQEAVNLVKNDPRYALDINAMHKDYLEALQNAIVETGFIGDTDTRGGLYADLDVVLEDWLSEGGDLEGNKFFNNSPTWDNLPDTQNVRGLIAAAGGPKNIKAGYVIPQYFKDKPNVPYADTPTNVVDERLRLERIIKNEIQTPELKEGLLKRYLDYDEFIEGLPADRAEQLLDYTNKDVAFNLDLFKDQFDLQKPYYPGEMESINSILFDWEEPEPIQDAVLADIEDWDLNAEGNPIDPRKKPEGMSKFKQELSAQYNYLLTLDTPTNVVDDLDDVISKTDGVENLNKAKQIMNKNPGVFKKIFSVLEKLDIGDQVITKAVLPTLGRMGVAGATGPLALAYAGYEMALLLADVASSTYQAKTTDETFWENFGEISDKYSIAYKISKPVYDIILGNLSTELEQEDEEFIPQYSYGR